MAEAPSKAEAAAALRALPLAFEPAASDGYLARGSGYELLLDERGTTLALNRGSGHRPAVLRSVLVGGAPVTPRAEGKLPGVVNEYRGDSKRVGVPTFGQIAYPAVYPGIDALFHGRGGALEYDFNVSPGVDPGRIGMRLEGARGIRVTRNGDLIVRILGGTLTQSKPVAFQRIAGRRVPVNARYTLSGGTIGFALGQYDRSRPLVIDPILSYATYIGGGGTDKATSVGVGSDGSLFIAGSTASTNLMGTTRSLGDLDAFVVRLDPSRESVLYATFIGGHTYQSPWIVADDVANDMFLNGTVAYIVGDTKTSDFPSVASPEDVIGSCSGGGMNAFITFISSAGAISYSQCFGGASDDSAQSIAYRFTGTGLNRNSDIAVAGWTKSGAGDPWGSGTVAGFQGTPGGSTDGFMLQIRISGSVTCHLTPGSICTSIRYRTFIGGTGTDIAYGVAYEAPPIPGAANPANPEIFVTGDTTGSFPVSSGSSPGGTDAWVARYTPSNQTRTFGVVYGGSGTDHAYDLALDSANNIYLVGSTDSATIGGVGAGEQNAGNDDGFIAKFNSGGTLQNGTFVGGTNNDSLTDIALQENGSGVAQYAVGETSSGASAGFTPRNTVNGHPCADGNQQAFVVKRIPNANPQQQILACLGGAGANGDVGTGVAVAPGTPSAPSADGTILVGGNTGGGFAGVNGVKTTHGGGSDAFIAELKQIPPTIDSGPAAGSVVSSSVQFGLSTSESGMTFRCNSPTSDQLVASSGIPTTDTNCPGSTASYTGLADGPHTLQVVAMDAFGSASAITSRDFTVDTTPPSGFDLTSPGEGDAVSSTTPSFTWAEATDLHGPVTYSLVIDGQPAEMVAPPACAAGSCSVQSKTIVPNGAHTWKVVAADAATPANSRDSTSTRNFSVIDPLTAGFTIAPNPALVGRSVAFDGSPSNTATHPIAKYEWDLDGDGTFETDTGPTATAGRTYVSPGTVVVALRVTETTGAMATSSQTLKINDPTNLAAQVGVSINAGAQYTNDPSVDLTINSPPGTTALLIANDGGFVAAVPKAVAKKVPWKLDSSGPERLPKTVYLRFLTGPFASPNYTDDIILDERPPVVDAAVVAGPPAASGASVSKLRKWKVKVKAHDTNSGVGFVQVAISKKKPGKLLKYKKTVRVKLAARPKFLRARDRAGNFSKWKKLR
ncbi:MAG: hypothetical protein QOJ29_5112 [Thermoleophilaceae bacterium]|nr:hypothetical protein [Thermoleophilaceae bacterium]